MPLPNDMVLNRAELHRLVWQKPVKAIANELGITSDRLTELCRKLEVPYPTAHYWKRKSAGLKVVELSLPRASTAALEAISLATRKEEELCLAAPIDAKCLFVPTKLNRPHRVVRQWWEERKRLQDAHPNNRAALAWSESQRRQHRILDTLFKAAEAYGFSVRSGETFGSFVFQYKRAAISCRLRQKKRRVQVVNRLSGTTYYEGCLSPNLLFTIVSKFDVDFKIRREWCDSPTSQLEDMIGDILKSVLHAGSATLEAMDKRENRERLEREQRLQRLDEEVRQQQDERQWAALVNMAADLETVTKVQRLLEALAREPLALIGAVGDRTLQDWFDWATKRCGDINPVPQGASAVFGAVSKAGDGGAAR